MAGIALVIPACLFGVGTSISSLGQLGTEVKLPDFVGA
jgi:hypothetical protein